MGELREVQQTKHLKLGENISSGYIGVCLTKTSELS